MLKEGIVAKVILVSFAVGHFRLATFGCSSSERVKDLACYTPFPPSNFGKLLILPKWL